jgi:hypothetical protein
MKELVKADGFVVICLIFSIFLENGHYTREQVIRFLGTTVINPKPLSFLKGSGVSCNFQYLPNTGTKLVLLHWGPGL